MIVPDISPDIFKNFNSVTYYDEPHKYFLNDKQLTSVTTLIHKYEEPFDEDYWARVKGEKFGLEAEEVKRGWRFINKKATMKGSIIHDYAENLFLNKVFPYPSDIVTKEFGFDPIYDEFIKTKKLVDEFYKFSFNKLIPIKTELVVCDEEFQIGGMVDLLVYNVKAREFQIWDYKTNSSDDAFSDNKERYLKGPLYLIPDTDIDKYSLQLSAYKFIIEKYTSLKIGNCYLVWLSHKNLKFEIKKCLDYTEYVDTLFRENRNCENDNKSSNYLFTWN